MHALIIAIDVYTALPNEHHLQGAVADANAMEEYVKSRHCARVVKLLNSQATRGNILNGLDWLIKDGSTHWNEAILIYFAGHGISFQPSDGCDNDLWDNDAVQAILPYDYDATNGCHAISDRAISAYLWRLACARGNNVTVIMDCCHSGIGTSTNGRSSPGGRDRGAERLDALPRKVQANVLSEEYHPIQVPSVNATSCSISHFAHPGLHSHVRLAACGPDEQAWETGRRGVFTSELLRVLDESAKESISYEALMDRLPAFPYQHPQCHGGYRSRPLFGQHSAYSSRASYRVERDGGKIVLLAGSINGIAKDSRLQIYPASDPKCKGKALCTLAVDEVRAVKTVLDSPYFDVDAPLYGQPLSGGEEYMRLCVAPGALMSLYQRTVRKGYLKRNVICTDPSNLDTADLAISLQSHGIGGQKEIILDNLWCSYEAERMPMICLFTSEALGRVLDGASHFFSNLRRTPRYVDELPHPVSLCFTKLILATDIDHGSNPVLQPSGSNLIVENRVQIVADPAGYYGIQIKNTTTWHLYMYVYYFNGSNFSIFPFYETGKTRGSSGPLSPNSSLTIGYGHDGSIPICFGLEDGRDKEVGWLKLFVSTQPADMHALPQFSPFGDIVPRGPRFENDWQHNLPGFWNSILVPIILRAPTGAEANSMHKNVRASFSMLSLR